MLTCNELISLREELANGEITIAAAKELCWNEFKEGERSWHTKDWKERRKGVIKDKCEICAGKKTLTLQHLSHPKKYNEWEREITKKYAQIFIDTTTAVDKYEFSAHLIKNYDYIPVPLCPNCKNRNPNKRMRKTPQFLCKDCHHEFDEPIYKSINELIATFFENEDLTEVRDKCFVSKNEWKNQFNLSQVRYWLQREKAKAKNKEAIEKEAFLLYLNGNIKYLSFVDTITACNLCAFNFDINKMELCPECNAYYKGIQYPTCIQCLPEDRRKAALEKIEFGKDWRAMHKQLGIE